LIKFLTFGVGNKKSWVLIAPEWTYINYLHVSIQLNAGFQYIHTYFLLSVFIDFDKFWIQISFPFRSISTNLDNFSFR
jgi:hypothetical protein